jgi:hypothetical protein
MLQTGTSSTTSWQQSHSLTPNSTRRRCVQLAIFAASMQRALRPALISGRLDRMGRKDHESHKHSPALPAFRWLAKLAAVVQLERCNSIHQYAVMPSCCDITSCYMCSEIPEILLFLDHVVIQRLDSNVDWDYDQPPVEGQQCHRSIECRYNIS